MTPVLRICLIIVSVITLLYMMRKIRHSKLQIEYSLFWIMFAVMLIIISIFPQIIYALAALFGIESPANLVFVFIIFILLLKLFMMTIELSQLEYKLRDLIQQVAIRDKERDDDKGQD